MHPPVASRTTRTVALITAGSVLVSSLPLTALAGGGASPPAPMTHGNAADVDLGTLGRAVGLVGSRGRLQPAEEISRADYEACQAADETAFRSAIQTITEKALAKGVATIDFKALVDDEWRREGLDRIVDARVDLAVAEVRGETSWGNLISSLANKDKAQQLATAVAERVYRSEPVKAGIEGLASGVGREIGKRLEVASVDAAEPAMRCMQAFLGPRYGSSIARIVTTSAEGQFAPGADAGAADVSPGALIKQSSGGITGAAVLVLRRQLANIASRIGQRLVGSILSRLVSVVAGGVGLVLIAKDIWDLRHGVLPIVADEMKAAATKDKVREELATALAEIIGEHMKEIAGKTADHVIDVWRDFRRAHAMVLDTAERDSAFRAYLDTLAAAELPRIDEVAALIVAAEGQPGLARRLADGTLDEAVRRMPPAAMEIARATRSVETGLKWTAVAGADIDAVVANDIYRRLQPEDVTPASLQRILMLDDRLAITRVAAVSRSARDTLFDLGTDELKALARNLSETELELLSGYLTGLAGAPRERVLKTLAADPGSMRLISSEPLRRAVIASRDQSAAVEIMFRPQGVFDPVAAFRDLELAWNGEVQPRLIWEKHPFAVGALGVLALVVLLLLRRLFRPRRGRRAVAETSREGEALVQQARPRDMAG